MSAAAIIWVCLQTFGLGIILSKHGEPREENYNIWLALAATAINVGLLWWGGFF